MGKFVRPANTYGKQPPHRDVERIVHAFLKAGHKVSHTDAIWAWQQVCLNTFNTNMWVLPVSDPGEIFNLCKDYLEITE